MPPIQIKKTMFGGYRVTYDCLACGEKLRSPLDAAGTQDSCPNCNIIFVVPGAKEREELKRTKDAEQEHKRQVGERNRQLGEQRQREKAEARMRAQEEAELRRQRELQRQQELRMKQAREKEEEFRGQPPIPPPPPPSNPVILNTLEEQPSQSVNAKKKNRARWVILAMIALLLIPVCFWLRNNGLRDKLRSCETYGVVEADVYYDGYFSYDVVVFDLQDGGSPTARRIDPVHLFLQFSAKLESHSVDRVVLARNGQHVFYFYSSDLRRLSDSYAGGGRVWAFNHLPENARTMSGAPAYGQWTGGWLGVLQKQMEDLNEFIRDWTGY